MKKVLIGWTIGLIGSSVGALTYLWVYSPFNLCPDAIAGRDAVVKACDAVVKACEDITIELHDCQKALSQANPDWPTVEGYRLPHNGYGPNQIWRSFNGLGCWWDRNLDGKVVDSNCGPRS